MAREYENVRIKGQGLADELHSTNETIRQTIKSMSADLHPTLELRAAESEVDVAEALKLYRDMNHLSLAGGITCEQVINHVQSHTVVLYFGGQAEEQQTDPILVTAATFSMRNQTMMLRLLATHPRMTRKGFGRVTVHFLKELCRFLRKTDILAYTYPSSAPFYKALHFRHTNPGLPKPTPAAPETESAADAAAAREASRDARRVFSAKENEMICYIQPTMEQVLEESLKAVSVHPYACTRRRAAQPVGQPPKALRAASPAALVSAAAATSVPAVAQRQSPSSRDRKPPAHQKQPPTQRIWKQPRPAPRERVIAPPRERSALKAIGSPLVGPGGVPANGYARRSAGRSADRTAAEVSGSKYISNGCEGIEDDDSQNEPSEDTVPLDPETEGASLSLTRVSGAGENAGSLSDSNDAEDGTQRKRRLEKDEYQVERIVGVRSNGGELQYLIKWKGWQPKFNTWEPLHHLKSLQSEIDAFEGSLKAAKFA